MKASSGRRHIGKGEYLFREGEPAEQLYYVADGKIRVGKVTPDGRELTFRLCGPGDFIGEVMPYCSPCLYTVEAKATEDTKVAVIAKEALEEALYLNSDLAVAYMRWMGVLHQRTQSKFRDLILHGKKGALYSTLIRMSNSYGIRREDGSVLLDIELTNQELANYCGMAREVANRMLAALKKEKKIGMENGKIVLLDMPYLRNEIHCENCPADICNIE
ncbi:Crp/Fnr family transcriptional regulator [Edaphobacillus lindanitolerans]|uniref:CRP/FNR family transcriptional regulator, anaerobic regulatory protein n=1 Tax=Edaphobacillus lindanitolerans TaxID=550447 RepID=A0A1U7PQ64_9BACI|nr:Crp/Fnr family transcriptional regulator [Edaphobacillus lindanitolerans]SIT84672.1 CRP/FNR family transcriptional regulator, anaerobic regulatory protein [Edaphobacillus lindanitolerans]